MANSNIAPTSIEIFKTPTHQGSTKPTLERIGFVEGNRTVLLIICDSSLEEGTLRTLAQYFGDKISVFLSPYQAVSTNITEQAVAIARELQQMHKIKRVNVFGIGRGSHLAQTLATHCPKVVRRVILLNPSSTDSLSLFGQLVHQIEKLFPAGLPLSGSKKTFDIRSSLHRIRCPTLVLASAEAVPLFKSEAKFIAKKIPNSWLKEVANPTNKEGLLEIEKCVEEFLEVSVKSAQ